MADEVDIPALPPMPIYRDFDTGQPSGDSWRYDHALAAWQAVCFKIIEQRGVKK